MHLRTRGKAEVGVRGPLAPSCTSRSGTVVASIPPPLLSRRPYDRHEGGPAPDGRRGMIRGPAAAAEHSGRDAKRAVYAVFIANGFALATWASRIPQVRDGLGVTPAGLGLILLSAAVGSLLAM